MSGRHEQEMHVDKRIKARLEVAPEILTDYYYSMIGAGKTYNTAEKYINYVLAFTNFTFGDECKEDFYNEVKPLHINKYIASLRTKEVDGKVERTSDSMRSVQWSALNAFFKFLTPDHIQYNPVASTDRPKMKDNPQVVYLTDKEIAGVLAKANEDAPKKLKNRDLCILKLGFSSGLRVSAITQIDLDDVDLQHNQIKVTEKGDYDNYIMFGDNMKAQLEEWIMDRARYYPDCETNALFVSTRGQRISDDTIDYMFKKYAKGVTDKKVHPHVMRHSCATNLYEKTGDIYLCAKQLHHKNVTTTQRYAELSNEKQKAATNILDQLI